MMDHQDDGRADVVRALQAALLERFRARARGLDVGAAQARVEELARRALAAR